MKPKIFHEKVRKIDKEIYNLNKTLSEKIKKKESSKLLAQSEEHLNSAESHLFQLKTRKSNSLMGLKKISEEIGLAKKNYLDYEISTKRCAKIKNRLKQTFSKPNAWVIIAIIGLTMFTFFWIFKFLNAIRDQLINIFSKGFGSYQFSQIFVIGLAIFLLGFLLCEIFWISNLFERKKFPWVTITVILMVCFFLAGVFYTHIIFGQEDLSLFLRNSSNLAIVGNLSCSGSSLVLMAGDSIKCEMSPEINILESRVSFKYLNKSVSGEIDFINLTFVAPKDIDYLYFKIRGVTSDGISFDANVGNPYHFYTIEEYSKMRENFTKYLGIILAIVFISIPIIMTRFKELAKRD